MTRLPPFTNEQEEAAFWDANDSTEFLEDTAAVDVAFVDARPAKKLISLRLEPGAIDRLKLVARQKGVGYQTLMRMWVMERLALERP